MKKRLLFSFMLFMAAVAFALLTGNSAISTADIFHAILGSGSKSSEIILFQVRLPRIIAAAGCGAALSVSGFLLQESLDNRIASPGLLGINNGAGLFVLFSALFFPYQSGMKCLMAFLGALMVTLLLSVLSVRTGMSKTSVILSGVAISALCTSAVDLIISLKPETVADKVAFQIGGFSSVRAGTVAIAIPLIIVGVIVSVLFAPSMDILGLGDETARSLGLPVSGIRMLIVITAALLAGASISMCGILGFVGLIVPNVIRMGVSGKCREKILLCVVWGATFLLTCDSVSRLIAFPYELPCGLILSLIGGPFLIWILIKKRKRLKAD